jgi:hypothetical protein
VSVGATDSAAGSDPIDLPARIESLKAGPRRPTPIQVEANPSFWDPHGQEHHCGDCGRGTDTGIGPLETVASGHYHRGEGRGW